jgi:hypothetical protein
MVYVPYTLETIDWLGKDAAFEGYMLLDEYLRIG